MSLHIKSRSWLTQSLTGETWPRFRLQFCLWRGWRWDEDVQTHMYRCPRQRNKADRTQTWVKHPRTACLIMRRRGELLTAVGKLNPITEDRTLYETVVGCNIYSRTVLHLRYLFSSWVFCFHATFYFYSTFIWQLWLLYILRFLHTKHMKSL